MRHLLIVAALMMPVSRVAADDAYYLKYEESGFDQIVGQKDLPKRDLLQSVEVLVFPDKPFSLRVETHGGVVELSGLLNESDGKFQLEWNSALPNNRSSPDVQHKNPRLSDRREKLSQLETAVANTIEFLNYQRSVAQPPPSELEIKRTTERLQAQRKIADEARREYLKERRAEGITEVQLELNEPKVLSSVSGEVAKAEGRVQKFERAAIVTLRRAEDVKLRQPTAARVRILSVPVRPAGLRRQPNRDEAMMIDAIEHEYRFQKRIRDQRNPPTTFGDSKSQLGPQLNERLLEKPRK